jgi:hypothetical protein
LIHLLIDHVADVALLVDAYQATPVGPLPAHASILLGVVRALRGAVTVIDLTNWV